VSEHNIAISRWSEFETIHWLRGIRAIHPLLARDQIIEIDIR
jgi:hypothetical protein